MENDPYEIWREAMSEISRQQELAAQEFELEMQTILDGDKMDEKNEKNYLIRSVLLVRTLTIGILVVVFGALTYALIMNRLNGLEFLAACSVWFGLAILFFWGTDLVKKDKEDE